MREYWEGEDGANLQNLAFQSTSLHKLPGSYLASQKTNLLLTRPQTQRRKRCSLLVSSGIAVKSKSTTSTSDDSRKALGTPVIALGTKTQWTPPSAISLLTASIDALQGMYNTAYCKIYLSKNHKTLQCCFFPKEKCQVFARFQGSSLKKLSTSTDCTTPPDHGQKRFKVEFALIETILPCIAKRPCLP